MRRLLSIGVTLVAVALAGFAHGGQIWTDGDGDGLPDASPLPATPSTNVTIGVWIDAQSFTWTNFLAYVEWSGDCFSYVSAAYVISGGSNFPIDNFSHPRGLGFGGSGYTQGGVDQIGNITLHVNTPVNCCVMPIIDVYNPYYVFSSLGNAPAGTYMLFTTNPGTCYPGMEPSGACCFPDGSCAVMLALQCQAAGGVYQGDGLSCAAANCPPPPETEACCFPDCSCADLTPEDCQSAGGVSYGPGTTCALIPCDCPPATGACCFADATCVDGLTQEQCSASGGLWYEGLFCGDPALICTPNAVESKSWGGIKGLYR